MLKDQGWPGSSGSQPHRRPIVPAEKTPYYVMSKEGSTRSHGSGFLASPARKSGMVQKQVTAQGWLGSTPEGRRPQVRRWRAGGSLAVASSTPATPLLPPAKMRELNRAPCGRGKLAQFSSLHRFAVWWVAPPWHGSKAGHSSGVAGVDARRATTPGPPLARWGLAGCRQLDPSHPALATREDAGVEPCPLRSWQAGAVQFTA